MCDLLGIRTRLSWSMDYELAERPTERLVSICRQAGADTYVSGPSARAYLDEAAFEAAKINLVYFDYAGIPGVPAAVSAVRPLRDDSRPALQHGARRAALPARAVTCGCRSSPRSIDRRLRCDDFHPRVSRVAAPCGDYEIVFVNDGSPDDSLDVALELFRVDPHVRVVDLARNFGHHKAMMTGLAHARGDLVFLIDSDLEEDPELLPSFVETLQRLGRRRRLRRTGAAPRGRRRAVQRLAVLQDFQPALGSADPGKPGHGPADDPALRIGAGLPQGAQDDHRRTVGAHRLPSDRAAGRQRRQGTHAPTASVAKFPFSSTRSPRSATGRSS